MKKTATEIAQWVIDNIYIKSKNDKTTDLDIIQMYHLLVDMITATPPDTAAPHKWKDDLFKLIENWDAGKHPDKYDKIESFVQKLIAAPTDSDKEFIVCSAIQYFKNKKGVLICGLRHNNCISTWYQTTGESTGDEKEGFLTSKNRFVERIEAGQIALNCGQIKELKYYGGKMLDSSDLYHSIFPAPTEVKSHNELIKCPQCEVTQFAAVDHSIPFFTYIHHCGKCGYIICESDWERVIQPEVKPEPVNDWVSVEDELPLTGKLVLVCKSDGEIIMGRHLQIGGWVRSFPNYNLFLKEAATYWQPLPPPPRTITI